MQDFERNVCKFFFFFMMLPNKKSNGEKLLKFYDLQTMAVK
jgi:hypothetical protein